MEIALRRLDGVDKISISISEQRFQVTYKAGASFQPWDIREAVAKAASHPSSAAKTGAETSSMQLRYLTAEGTQVVITRDIDRQTRLY